MLQNIDVIFHNIETTFDRMNNTVKPVLSSHSKEDQKLVLQTHYHLFQIKCIAECSPLMQVKHIAECSNGSILQYF